MGRSRRHVTLDDLPPAYREQALAQLRAIQAGAEPRRQDSATEPEPEAATPPRSGGRHREPNKTEARFNAEVLGGRGMYEALTFHVDGGAYTPDWLALDPATGAPTCYEVKGAHPFPSENRARFAFLTCRARFPFVAFRWFRRTRDGWTEEHRP